jgi:hypothetical protein
MLDELRPSTVQRIKRRKFSGPVAGVLGLLSLALVAACSDQRAPADNPSPTPVTDLSSARALWKASELDSYSFVVTSSCGERAGLGTYEIAVDGDESKVTRQEPHSGPPTVRSVPDLLDNVAMAIDGGADRVEVRYNASFGYPESIDIDYHQHGIDDEECYVLRDFRTR